MIGGRALNRLIVAGGVTAKTMSSGPAAALASMTAWRTLPGPESFVLVTVKVVAVAGPAPASTAPAARAPEARPRAMALVRFRSSRRSRSASTRRSRRDRVNPSPHLAWRMAFHLGRRPTNVNRSSKPIIMRSCEARPQGLEKRS